MLTVGVDLAAEAVTTAVARGALGRRCRAGPGAGCGSRRRRTGGVDRSGGQGRDPQPAGPQRFVEFVAQHQAGQFLAPVDVAGKDWRRRLALRETDLVTRDLTRLVPLSLATDRIGLAAMRCAGLLAHLTAAGRPVDRAGTGVVVEVYPAAALKHWDLTYRGYKGAAKRRRTAPTRRRHHNPGAVAATRRLRAGLPQPRPRPGRRHRRAQRPRRSTPTRHHAADRTRRLPHRSLDRATHHQPHRPHRRTPALTRSWTPPSAFGRPLRSIPETTKYRPRGLMIEAVPPPPASRQHRAKRPTRGYGRAERARRTCGYSLGGESVPRRRESRYAVPHL